MISRSKKGYQKLEEDAEYEEIGVGAKAICSCNPVRRSGSCLSAADSKNVYYETLTQPYDLKDLKITLLSRKCDDLLIELQKCQKELTENWKEIKLLKLKSQTLHLYIRNVSMELNRVEQYARKENVEIHGIQIKSGETIYENISKLAKDLSLPFQRENVVEMYQKKSDEGMFSPPVIVLRFNDRKISEKWIQKGKRCFMSDSFAKEGDSSTIRITENLTATNAYLYRKADEIGKALGFNYVWVKNGKIFMKKDIEEPTIKILCIDDLPKEKVDKRNDF